MMVAAASRQYAALYRAEQYARRAFVAKKQRVCQSSRARNQAWESPVSGTVNIVGADYPVYQLAVMLIAIALITALVAWFLTSATGRRIRAVVNNPELARTVGIPADKLARNTFVAGLSLGGIAGVLLAPIVAVHPGMGIDYVLKSFFVLVVGGLGNILGLVVGSGVIGGAEAVVSAAIDRTAGYSFVLVVALLFLWIKPRGLVNR